jgi:hypothetical protein
VTYHAPKGDSKVVEIWGHTFYDGKAEEIEVSDDIAKTIKGNRHFTLGNTSGGGAAAPPKEAKGQ